MNSRPVKWLLVTALMSCRTVSTTPPERPLGVAQPVESEAATPAPKVESPEPSDVWEFFQEDVEIDADEFLNGSTQELGNGFVLLGNEPPRALLHLDTFEIVPLPDFVGDPKGEVRFTSLVEHGIVVASVHERQQRIVRFQVLRLDTIRWEEAGRFDVPESRALHREEKRYSPIWVKPEHGSVTLRLTDEVSIHKSYALELDTLVWKEVPAPANDPAPCLMATRLEDDDRLSWGLAVRGPSQAGPCVAVRATTADAWRRIDDPQDEVAFMRRYHALDERRFLVTGGFGFTIFAFVYRAEIVDVVSGEIRSLGRQVMGRKLDVPGEPFLWLSRDSVVRFDPESETFSKSRGPKLPFSAPRWFFKLDDQRVLFAGHDEEKNSHYVIAGFRPAQ